MEVYMMAGKGKTFEESFPLPRAPSLFKPFCWPLLARGAPEAVNKKTALFLECGNSFATSESGKSVPG
jgi:hypothetical protein